MRAKAVRRPSGGSVRQHVDNYSPLEIHDDGPVAAAPAPTPVVNARNTNRHGATARGDAALQLPENGVVADRHSKPLQWALARFAANAVTEKMNKFSNPAGPTGVR
jgi:hypothetical protein